MCMSILITEYGNANLINFIPNFHFNTSVLCVFCSSVLKSESEHNGFHVTLFKIYMNVIKRKDDGVLKN